MKKINRTDLINFGNLELLAKQTVEGFITGLHKSPFHGFSVEFAEHRLYNTGEPTKHIDWKLFGKTDKLFTKKYDEETNLRCQFVIDCSSSMYFKHNENLSKIEYAILATASLIELAKKQRDAVGISLFTDTLEIHTPSKSSQAHHHFILQNLEQKLKAYTPNDSKQTNATDSLHEIAELCHSRSLIIIFTDLLNDPSQEKNLIEALQHLKHNKHETIVFQLIDKKIEQDFNLPNKPLKVIDMETNKVIKLHPSELKEKYNEQVSQYFKSIALKCGQLGIDFTTIDTNESLHLALQKFMVKRSKTKM